MARPERPSGQDACMSAAVTKRFARLGWALLGAICVGRFAHLGRWRRLSRSYEATTESATTWRHVSCVDYLRTKL